ncbi:Uncharacterised protein [Bordetella pertussis]|nr:Uncharacterised protein [Bordetella pertussis]
MDGAACICCRNTACATPRTPRSASMTGRRAPGTANGHWWRCRAPATMAWPSGASCAANCSGKGSAWWPRACSPTRRPKRAPRTISSKSWVSPTRPWCCRRATRPAPAACRSPAWRDNAGISMRWRTNTACSRAISARWKNCWIRPPPPRRPSRCGCCCCTTGSASCCTIRSCPPPWNRTAGPATRPAHCAGASTGKSSTPRNATWMPWPAARAGTDTVRRTRPRRPVRAGRPARR